MANRNKTEVYIYGSKYTVLGSESEEYIHKLALYVDKKMREFSEVNSALSSGMISVLAAINIADDYFKTLDKLENITNSQQAKTELMDKEYKQKIEELTLQIQKLKSDSDSMEELTQKLKKLEDENTAKEQSIIELSSKYEQLKSEYKQMEELYQEEYNQIKNKYEKTSL